MAGTRSAPQEKDFISYKGNFLLAETDLGDPNFSQTLILLIDHDPQGAFGLVVNRRSEITLGEGADLYKDSPFSKVPLYLGGPVSREYMFCLHSGLPEKQGSPHCRKLLEDLYFEPVFTQVENWILNHPLERPPRLRLFAGYSGWGPGQLEEEMSENSWALLPAQSDLVFHSNPEQGWKEALERKGGIYWLAAKTGYKPSLN